MMTFIKENQILESGDRIVVGISGGADSVCLLHLLWSVREEYNLQLYGVHIHHGLRNEADEDAKYVEKVGRSLQIPIQIYHVNVREEAKKRKQGEEETGRQLRYEKFHEEISRRNANKIALGHHQNDQSETFLMRLMRGSGSLGLQGMKPAYNNIIRPLLGFTREEVETYCLEHQLIFCVDHTNDDPIYTRNRIRLELIPYIQKYFNPNIIKTLYQTAQLLGEQEAYMEKETNKIYSNCIRETEEKILEVDIRILQNYDIALQRRILYKVLVQAAGEYKNIGQDHIELIRDLISRQSGREIHLPYGVQVKKQYDLLIFSKGFLLEQGYYYPLQIPGIEYVSQINRWIQLEIIEKRQHNDGNDQNSYTNYLDYDKIKNELVLRTRQSGDLIALSNVSGMKKLKKFFIDQKIPQDQRGRIPLLAEGNEILWIVGYRYSTKYAVSSETKRILKITLEEDLMGGP